MQKCNQMQLKTDTHARTVMVLYVHVYAQSFYPNLQRIFIQHFSTILLRFMQPCYRKVQRRCCKILHNRRNFYYNFSQTAKCKNYNADFSLCIGVIITHGQPVPPVIRASCCGILRHELLLLLSFNVDNNYTK